MMSFRKYFDVDYTNVIKNSYNETLKYSDNILLCLMILLFYFNPYLNLCIISSIITCRVMKYTRVEYDVKIFLKPNQKVKTIDTEEKSDGEEEKSVGSVEYNSDCQENLLFRFKKE